MDALRDREKLKALLAEYGSERKVAEAIGCNKSSVNKWRKHHNLDLPEQHRGRVLTEEEARQVLLRGIVPLSQLAKSLQVEEDAARQQLELWKFKGYNLIETPQGFTISRDANPVKQELRTEFYGNSFRFAIISDTHGSSLQEKLDELNGFYDLCVMRGVRDVLHAGDIVAGKDVYKGQLYEVKPGHYGYDAQRDHIVANYPRRDGLTTYFITGNHCLSFFKSAGADIGIGIAKERTDMKYVGQMAGRVVVSDRLKVDLLHPKGGNPYAKSYRAQKTNEAMGRTKNLPHIKGNGHLHTTLFFEHMGIYEFQAGCFEGQTTFIKSMGIDPVIGGWIVEVNMSGDEINRLVPEWVRMG